MDWGLQWFVAGGVGLLITRVTSLLFVSCFLFTCLSYLIGLLPDLTVSKPEFQCINTAAVKQASLPAQCCCRGKRLMLLSWDWELQSFHFAGKALPKTCVLWDVVIQFSMDQQSPGERQIFSLYTEFLFFLSNRKY